MLHLLWKSLLNRRSTVILTLLSIAVSVALLLGVEHIRKEVRSSFANTVSGTDLIVGGRTGSVQLLLYSVFRIGNATNNISWQSYQEIARAPGVAWTIPISLGDSHRGYRVLGTTADYFHHYEYGNGKSLRLLEGEPFHGPYDAVLGAEVAKALNYSVGDRIVIAHGGGNVSFAMHDDHPFTVTGILAPTGTPVDRTVHVSLGGIEAIHQGWPGKSANESIASGVRAPEPEAITAALVGLKSRMAVFSLQRQINNYTKEPLSAILPGVALQELWGLLGVAETAMIAISALVVVTGLFGMLAVVWSSLNERRREMAILRSVGARPVHILCLLVGESCALVLAGILAGMLLLWAGLLVATPLIQSATGLALGMNFLTPESLLILLVILLAGLLAGLPPAIKAYRLSVADGMTVRL